MQHKNKRALSVQIPELIIQDDDIFFDYCFYFALHNSHTGGVTKNYRSKFNEIASRLNIHPNTVRKYVGRICQRGWAWRSQKDLYTLSQGKLKEQFGLENKRCRRFSIHTIDFNEIKSAIRSKVIESNLIKQAYQIRIKDYHLLRRKLFGNIKAVNLTRGQENLIRKTLKYNSVNTKSKVSDITVSKRKIAQLINRKSPKTGTNFLRKAKDYFKIEKRTTVIESNVGRRYFDEFRKHYTGGHFLFYFNGRIFERKCDLVSFNYQNQITA